MGLLRRLLGHDAPVRERGSTLPATWPPPDRTPPDRTPPDRTPPDRTPPDQAPAGEAVVPSPTLTRLAADIDTADWALVPGPPGFSGANVLAALRAADAASDDATAVAASRALLRTLGDPDNGELWPAAVLVVPLLTLSLLDEHLPHWPARAGLATVAEVSRWDRVAPGFERIPDEDGTPVELLPTWHELRDSLVQTLGAGCPDAGEADAGEAVRAAAVVRALQGLPY